MTNQPSNWPTQPSPPAPAPAANPPMWMWAVMGIFGVLTVAFGAVALVSLRVDTQPVETADGGEIQAIGAPVVEPENSLPIVEEPTPTPITEATTPPVPDATQAPTSVPPTATPAPPRPTPVPPRATPVPPTPTPVPQPPPTPTPVPPPPPTPTPVPPPPPTPIPPTPTPEPVGIQLTWGSSAMSYRGDNGRVLTMYCPPSGSPGTVWGGGVEPGVGSVYTDDSSVCTAAVQRGLISFDQGGNFRMGIVAGQCEYRGVSANGVSSRNYPTDNNSVSILCLLDGSNPAWDGSFVLYS